MINYVNLQKNLPISSTDMQVTTIIVGLKKLPSAHKYLFMFLQSLRVVNNKCSSGVWRLRTKLQWVNIGDPR